MNSGVDQDEPIGGSALEARPSFDVGSFMARFGGVAGLKVKAGTSLYSQGDDADCLYYLQKGQVRLTVVSAHGKEATIALLEAGDFCGEGCLIGERLRVSTATCTANSVVARTRSRRDYARGS